MAWRFHFPPRKYDFKEHGSTNACTSMVKETIQYYLQKDSNVYGTVLDGETNYGSMVEQFKLVLWFDWRIQWSGVFSLI